MKKSKITSLCLLVILLSCGSNAQNNFKESITNNTEYESTMDSAKAIVGQFIELMEAEKYEEALDFYLKEQNWFFVALKYTTDNFEFHDEFIIPMLFDYKDIDTAYKEAIRILEMNQLLAEAVIGFSGGIPAHYGQLLTELGQMYIDIERYEDALALTNKMLDIATEKEDQALVYYNIALIYELMGNNEAALKSAEKAISILKELKLQKGKLYNDCLEIIAEVKGKSKKK